MAKDYYKLLGVKRGATAKEIRQAYRSLARKHHPDVNPGDKRAESKFKEISEAYSVLSDPEKRKKYDQFGDAAFGGGGGAGRGAQQGFGGIDFEGFDFGRFSGAGGARGGGFSDLFGDLFGSWGRRTAGAEAVSDQPQRGKDIQYSMDIAFEDAASGVSATISFQKEGVCPQCRGSGCQSGSAMVECPTCGGSGQDRTGTGPLNPPQPCLRCAGSGRIPAQPCRECAGRGKVPSTARVNVKIPPGVDTGSRVRLAGKGEPGIGGAPAGDLFIVTRVQPHALFERKGDNLSVEVPVTFSEAALGAWIEVPTLEGKTQMALPPGSPSGQQFRLRGKGVAHLKGDGRGDLYVRINVTVPRNLDTRSRDLLREFARLNPEQPRV